VGVPPPRHINYLEVKSMWKALSLIIVPLILIGVILYWVFGIEILKIVGVSLGFMFLVGCIGKGITDLLDR